MRSTHRLTIIGLIVVGLLLTLALRLTFRGFSIHSVYYSEQKKVALAAVTHFHELFNDRQFETIWSEADPLLQHTVRREEFVELVRRLGLLFGKIGQTNCIDAKVSPDGAVVTLVFNSDCERGAAHEEFAWHISGKTATLMNYHIWEGYQQPAKSATPAAAGQ